MWRIVLGYGKEMRDESWGTGTSTFAKRTIICLRQNDHRRPTSPCNVLWLTLQGRLDDLTELSFCVLQPPLRSMHDWLLAYWKFTLVRLSGLLA